MSELAAVFQDKNEHEEGKLLCDNTNGKCFVEGKLICVINSNSEPDGAGHPNPKAATGSSKMFVNGLAVHRNNDLRDCGAKTIVTGQTSLYVS